MSLSIVNRRRRLLQAVLVSLVSGSLSGCGGLGGATVGGSVTGLATSESVVLEEGAGTTLTVTADGTFTFSPGLKSGDAYSVTVLTQPTGQSCTVQNGSGTVDSSDDDITGIAVACTSSAELGGSVSGLIAGTAVILSDGVSDLPVAANGNFTFTDNFAAGQTYTVSIATQPSGHTCTVAGATGTIVANVLASVTVSCS